ncbi:Acetyltransferase (GNAT) family protein [Lentibacillus halodurans]|uniref:Acetyltransferase (GNAT) family protein n=1 Tax=Lentibacillus halodurans TaxID=237679 RepID=A0A1I0X5N0_9BACI|nr:GNAT family N-acetyltransferase [Lentibacillus halodurans]SFA96134.1 Acetyltransferase (GNAT) family protein [Lentibacillus halodurans]
MGAFDRLAIYRKVKIVEGENFVTIEDTKNLAEVEMIELVRHFMEDLAFEEVSSVNVLVNSQFSESVDRLLEREGFQLHDHVVMVRKELDDWADTDEALFSLRSMNELPLEEFTRVWQEAAADSPNAAPIMDMNEQMQNVRRELGLAYQSTCRLAYDGRTPIGVVMPHIEPDTRDEGRLFYIGLIPEERGKGKSKTLHKQALQVLKDDFGASYYIGSTSEKNTPMLRTFEANGCIVIERNRVYTRKIVQA